MRSWGNEIEKGKKQIQVVSEQIPAEGNEDSVPLGILRMYMKSSSELSHSRTKNLKYLSTNFHL